jgi:SAM-dependent methyltransferase
MRLPSGWPQILLRNLRWPAVATSRDEIVSNVERLAGGGAGVNEILSCLRALSLADFGELFLTMPNARYPALSKALPRMASADVQRAWTGADGLVLLQQTLSFTTVVTNKYRSQSPKELAAARVLDFGCGYGRIMRAMYYFCDPERLYGCDPWTDSLEHCRQDGMLGHFALSDYLPDRIPFDGKFDLLYAYSVFTHTSARATKRCLDVLVAACGPGGMIAITIRPAEYWNAETETPREDRARCAARHREGGFAFHPHLREPIDGDLVYGDTSMSLEWLAQSCPQLKILSTEPVPTDPLQTIVYLTPRP